MSLCSRRRRPLHSTPLPWAGVTGHPMAPLFQPKHRRRKAPGHTALPCTAPQPYHAPHLEDAARGWQWDPILPPAEPWGRRARGPAPERHRLAKGHGDGIPLRDADRGACWPEGRQGWGKALGQPCPP